MRKPNVKQSICIAVCALLVCIAIAVPIVAGVFSNAITKYLFGVGSSTATPEAQEVIAKGNELCEDVEEEAIVLLKNDGTLPLKNVSKVNVFGWASTQPVLAGTGSGNVDTANAPTLTQTLENVGIESNPALIKKYTDFKSSPRNPGGYIYSVNWTLFEPAIETYTDSDFASYSAFSDTAIMFISRLGGEDNDIPSHYLTISDTESKLLKKLGENFSSVIVVINTCNAMELGFLNDEGVNAAVSIGSPGQTGLHALASVLVGSVNPSGRTADIYAYDAKSAPSYGENAFGSGSSTTGDAKTLGTGVREYADASNFYYIDYNEGIYVGYRYYETRYASGSSSRDESKDYYEVVQYPFGYGMSYSEFTWEVVSSTPAEDFDVNGKIEITVKVTNTSDVAGRDVVQCYYTPPYYDGEIEKAFVNLCAFEKTELIQPKGSATVTLSFDVRDMASYDYNNKNDDGKLGYTLDSGNYEVRIMKNSHELAGSADDFVITYRLDETKVFDTDEVSGNEIKNRFTGTDAEGGIAADGSQEVSPVKFLSRNDWAGTFPNYKQQSRKMAEIVVPTKSYKRDDTESDKLYSEFPVWGEKNGMDISEMKNADFDDPRWEKLLNQVTLNEAIKLVEYGGYQTLAVASVGKTLVTDLDGPQGLNTQNVSTTKFQAAAYPSSTCLAQTFNKELAYKVGASVGAESRELGVSGWYAPGVNIHRSPYSGRNFEYYSEDPLLSGLIGGAVVKGAGDAGLYCYVKHFAVNDVETRRSVNGLYTWVNEQAAREIYLKPFEIIVKKAETKAMMSAFNRIGATWTGGSYALLTEILRGEWGFNGTVLTDYYISTAYGYMNIDQGLRAGNDCWLTGVDTLATAPYAKSKTAQWNLRRATKNILYTYANYDTIEAVLPPPVWWAYIALIDLALLSGAAVYVYFSFFRKPKAKKQDSNE